VANPVQTSLVKTPDQTFMALTRISISFAVSERAWSTIQLSSLANM
jgi:hypothetical protein